MSDMTSSLVAVEQNRGEVISQIWRLIADKYPLFEEREVDWVAVKKKYLASANTVDFIESLYKSVEKMLLELNDPHTRLVSSPSPEKTYYPFHITSINNDYYISSVFPYVDTSLAPGMKIIAVNETSIEKIQVSLYAKFPYESENVRKATVINEIMNGAFGDAVHVTATDGKRIASDTMVKQPLNRIDFNDTKLRDKLRPCMGKKIDRIGFIKILTFNHRSVFQNFLTTLKECGDISSLIIDVRGNNGGLIEQAKLVASTFIKKERLIGYRVDAKGLRESMIVKPLQSGFSKLEKLVILCDEFTASSAEFIFISALIKSDDRICIVGVRTAGLAHEATVFPLYDDSRIQVTTYKYLSPKKEIVREVGIDPDVRVNNSYKWLTEREDNQLDYAIKFCRND